MDFDWCHDNVVRTVMYSSCNGHFIVKEGRNYISERSKDDCTPWFGALLDFLYYDAKVPA